jgi:Fic family protein
VPYRRSIVDILQEIDKKMERINEIRPFEGVYLQQINQFFKIETTYSSNAIEGNTYTLEETKVILEDGITVGGHPLKEFYEVEGHGKAYDYMFSLIKKRVLTEDDILYCHQLFSKNIPDFISPGEYRKIEVIISGSRKILPKAVEVPEEMNRYIKWLDENRSKFHPVMFAAEAHRKLVNIHPFTDGNGRISRLVMNTFLYQDKLFPISIPVLRRSDYYSVLEKDETIDFGNYIAELELQTIKDLMRFLHLE